MLKMILCVDKNYGLSYDNKIPWSIKDEILHFSRLTTNSHVVMGRKTYESIGHILENRTNIIFSKNKNYYVENAIVTDNIEYVVNLSKNNNVWIIGGKEIFELFIDFVDEIVLSKLYKAHVCDLYFNPNLLKFFKLDNTVTYSAFEVLSYKSIRYKILDGQFYSLLSFNEIQKETSKLIDKYEIVPTLAIITVGNFEENKIYANKKIEFAKNAGFNIKLFQYKKSTNAELIDVINNLNNDNSINGILIQSPLPDNIDINLISSHIDVLKDVDCFHPLNVGHLYKEPNKAICPIPCTPLAIMNLLEFYKIELAKKHVVILGRSNLVSKPLIPLFLNKDATVIVCHSDTPDLKKFTLEADILVSAVGLPNFINKEHVKENAIVIDVGINRVDNKIYGDVNFDDVIDKVRYISPVPKGVGPVTVAMLFKNLLTLFKKQLSIND